MTSYSIVQKQQLSQLGAYLQEKRQEQGKSLEDISLQTYIRAQLLKAVETGDTSDLPQPIFVQGFIRRYADALGLDGTNFAKQFPVHSIPNTPRPVPRPATKVEMPYQTGLQKPVTSPQKPSVPKSTPEPVIGALPIEPADPLVESMALPDKPEIESVALPDKPEVESIIPEKATSDQPVASATKDFALDPNPMSDNELAALGLNGLGDGIGNKSPNDAHQSSPFVKEANGAEPTPLSPLGAMPPAEPIEASLAHNADAKTNWLPLGVGIVGIVAAIALIAPRLIGNRPDQQPATIETEESVAESPQPEIAPVAEAPDSAPEPETLVSDAPVNLQVEITEAGPSWVSVEVDGESVYVGLMDPGDKELWEGQQSITINVGNAGAALISSNGSEPTPAGNPGGAEFLTFSAEE